MWQSCSHSSVVLYDCLAQGVVVCLVRYISGIVCGVCCVWCVRCVVCAVCAVCGVCGMVCVWYDLVCVRCCKMR